MARFSTPIPQDKIGESFVWRDWFQKVSDIVFGTMGSQDSDNVNITGGVIDNTTINDPVITDSTASDGDKLVYSGPSNRWVSEAFSSVFVSDTEPPSPRVGDVWLDTSSGNINAVGNVVIKNTNYTITIDDYTVLCDASSTDIAVTLPAASTVVGHIYNIKKIDSTNNTVTITASGVDTVDGEASAIIEIQWVNVVVQSNGTNWYVL